MLKARVLDASDRMQKRFFVNLHQTVCLCTVCGFRHVGGQTNSHSLTPDAIMTQEQKTEQEFRAALAVCRDLFVKKAHDYGTAWTILRLPSLTDQLYIKASRIRTIEQNGHSAIDEGINAEFIGIVNYAIMGVVLSKIEADDLRQGLNPIAVDRAITLYDESAEEALQLMLKKNHDYGEAWRGMRVSSYTDLILVKILRTKQIETLDGHTLVSEGVVANYMDMMNYAVFGLIRLGVGQN